MAQNLLPKSVSELLSLAGLCVGGIGTKGAGIGLLQWTVANFTPIMMALQTKDGVFDEKRARTLEAYDALHGQQAQLRAFLLTGRKMLSVSWGEEWTTEWAQAGWTNQTTAVPRPLAMLKSIGNALKTLLAVHPSYEVATPRIDFTLSAITGLLGPLAGLETAVAWAKSAQKSAGDDREAAEDALRRALRSLIDVLAGLLPPDSPIWDDFGLNRPGDETTPASPRTPVLVATGPAQVTATVAPVPLATYYRWKYRIVDIDPDYRFAGRSSDPLKILPNLPLTGTLEVLCEAANAAGPSPPSPPATLALG